MRSAPAEIGDRARHLEDAVVGAPREAELFKHQPKHPFRLGVERAGFGEHRRSSRALRETPVPA